MISSAIDLTSADVYSGALRVANKKRKAGSHGCKRPECLCITFYKDKFGEN